MGTEDVSAGVIGFGEAGQAFAGAWSVSAIAFDAATDDPMLCVAKRRDYARCNISRADTLAQAVVGQHLILSLVTADQALAVALAAARHIMPGALYCDMNSVAPQTKRAAAEAIAAAGAHYIDVAVMAPVHPARLHVPLLVSGAQGEAGAAALRQLGFVHVTVKGVDVGRASAIKMIRSVMVKGLEALTAECMLAAQAAGVLEDVLASLDASEKAIGWSERADYNLDRMLLHGLRRAAEMEEVVRTLEELGTGAVMTQGTVVRQRAIGTLGVKPVPDGLAGKIARINVKQQGEDKAA
ncbi:DUF1932 domain-containing protein [Sphingobium algorifonticola]|uniref:NAD(P)-dependent oxidoreductase n=1 Tax=Sphingobium algorifonticola TaxID=2008318 RepID=A0A437J5Q3_9SPHN|nr:NAD(P)-dependent oxidoreductase [Sphingobium algorifonticola]RVT40124.1 NAD(P)-dependent oxidoreductase [Sphingobium algorifonticola]